MSAHKRCSNCEKSVQSRSKDGLVTISRVCKATGEKISNSKSNPGKSSIYYMSRKCDEFIPRPEYADQFINPIDMAMDIVDRGDKIKDIISPV
jgi:hypothetical protein